MMEKQRRIPIDEWLAAKLLIEAVKKMAEQHPFKIDGKPAPGVADAVFQANSLAVAIREHARRIGDEQVLKEFRGLRI